MDVAGPGDSVFLRGGTYRETISSVRSGLPGQPITVTSYNGEEVFISASDVVDGTWTETTPGSGIYSTQVTGSLPVSFWSVPNPSAGGSGMAEQGGSLVATVVNDSGYRTTSSRSLDANAAWNFFEQSVTWKVRGLSIESTGETPIPLDKTNAYFSVMTSPSNGYASDDSVSVRMKGNGNLALLLNKDTPNSWGTGAGSVTDPAITGFDLTLGPGTAGNVDYTLRAFPSGHVAATGQWAMSPADWSDGGNGSTSYVQVFAQEGVNPTTDTTQQFELKVGSYEIVAGVDTVLDDRFSDGDLATVPGNQFLAVPTSNVSSGYDQIFVDGEMQHEARHTNKVSLDLLEPDATSFTLSDSYTLTGAAFAGQGDDYFAGARFLGRVGQGWAWQTSVVSSSAGNSLQLDAASASTWWWPNFAGKTSDAGIGYLYGKLEFLDADREWHLQQNPAGPDTLYLRVDGGADPSTHLVERKTRNWAVNINGHDHIVVRGLNFRGGAVRLDGSGLVLEDSDARYLSHFLTFNRGSSVNGGVAQGGGIVVNGDGNIVRGTTIYDTAGSGIVANGSGHLLTRNHIHHTDYSGTYATGMSLTGSGHTATFNTIHDSGRDILRPTGSGLTVMYNDLSRAGRMALDVGIVYAYGINGEDAAGNKTRIAYNWVHENGNPSDPISKGIYLDNFIRNYVVDHNVIWDIGQTLTTQAGIKLNSPTVGNEVYHNTLIGAPAYNLRTWTAFPDNNPDPSFWTTSNHGMNYTAQNNWIVAAGTDPSTLLEDFAAEDFRPKPGTAAIDPATTAGSVQWQTTNGVTNVPAGFKLSMRYKNQLYTYHEVTGQGVTLPGINDGFSGTTPDSGAYEIGSPYWKAGVNGFQRPGLSLNLNAESISENGGFTTATVSRESPTTDAITVSLASSDEGEATVPATVTIPAGQTHSAPFAITAIDDLVRDRTQTVTITASAALHDRATGTVDVTDVLGHRTSELTVLVQDGHGNPLPDATIDVVMTDHAFKFGTQVRDHLFSITQTEFDGLSQTRRQNLLPDLFSQFGIPRYTPTWQDVVNYRTAVFDHFNHVVPTTGMQWVSYLNNGPAIPNAALALAFGQGLSVTGASVVWQRDRWPTPEPYRSAANPNPQDFHDALIADRLSATGILGLYSDIGPNPTIGDWKVLNEPIHEHYYADTFVAAGIYNTDIEAMTDYFQRARTIRPDVTLSINEFNILNSGDDNATIAYRDLINSLLAAGAPLDRIGIQAHMHRSDVTKTDITRRLDLLAETGLSIEISEFDTRDDAGQLTPAQQERVFRDMLEASFEHPSVDGFIMWGIWDPGHWRGNAPLYDQAWNVKAEAAPWFDLVMGQWMPSLIGQSLDASAEWYSTGNLLDGIYDIAASLGGQTVEHQGFELTEDSQLVVTIDLPEDFGDAPTPYPTLRSDDGARHIAVGPRLGSARDIDSDGQSSNDADGDDNNNVDDEDGVEFGGIGVTGTLAAVNILLDGAAAARVDAWIDFNRNDVWDAGEKILDDVGINQPFQTLNYNLPANLATGDTYARVRLSSAGGLDPTGLALDGEVEDYLIRIKPPQVESVVVNGGDSQRSGIETVRITFDRVVDIDLLTGDVFEIRNTTTSQVVTDIPAIDDTTGKTVVDLTFAPGPTVNAGGGLLDGEYQLTIDASRVNVQSETLDGDGDGTPGGNHMYGAIDNFYRKYGDYNGNGIVDLLDFAEFRRTFDKSDGDSGYLGGLDADGDQRIGLLDFAAFRRNFGT